VLHGESQKLPAEPSRFSFTCSSHAEKDASGEKSSVKTRCSLEVLQIINKTYHFLISGK
jgi:hypothetical protein